MEASAPSVPLIFGGDRPASSWTEGPTAWRTLLYSFMESIVRAGHLLFGDRWLAPLSRALRVSERTVRYWSTGQRPVPAGALRELAALLEAHAEACRGTAAEIAKDADPA